MDPQAMLFTVISDLTGGLVTDIVTLLTALIFFWFLLMGFDLLRVKLEGAFHDQVRAKNQDRWLLDADNAREQMKIYKGTTRGDLASRRYRRLINKIDRE